MEITIIEERDNPFFNRKDVKITLKHSNSPTPSKDELKKELAKYYKIDEEQTVIDYIFSLQGIGESFAKVRILNEKPKKVEVPKKEEGEKVETQASETA